MERVENMKEIKCPKCGEVFAVDESGYAQLFNKFGIRNLIKNLNREKKI